VFKDILYIPSAFISFNGHALDERTPLLRSQVWCFFIFTHFVMGKSLIFSVVLMYKRRRL
jgi:hypothetical protein